jgi:hypothetical protein
MAERRSWLGRVMNDRWTRVGYGLGLLSLLTEVLLTPSFDPHLEFWLVLPGWPVFVMLLVGMMNPYFILPAVAVGVLATGVMYGFLGYVVRKSSGFIGKYVKGKA